MLALRDADLEVDASGGLASVRILQTFENRFADPLRVTYQLPLPADAAVVGFTFVLDGERIVGHVERREDARERFEEAIVEGRTAALLEEDRSSIFTQEIGNLPAGATLLVEIEVEQPLQWSTAHGWTWRFPTVIAPRYLGAPGQTPDAERITQEVALAAPEVRTTITGRIGDITPAVTSPSHELTLDEGVVRLQGHLDRDVVLRWPVAHPEPSARLELARPTGHDATSGRLVVVPPSADSRSWRRDLIVLLDTSGSMHGAPIEQLKTLTKALIASLCDEDQLEIVEFSSRVHRWREAPVAMTPEARAQATAFVDQLTAGGGTDMHLGILEALNPLRDEACRQVVVMTDGLIGFEDQIIGQIRRKLPQGCRVHTVGVGSAPNRTLTRGAARAGGGHEAIVGLTDDGATAVADLIAHTARPLLVDLELTGSALLQRAPLRLPDLLGGSPAAVSLALRPEGGTLVLRGRTPEGPFHQELSVAGTVEGTGRRVIASRFARERVADLEVERASGGDRNTIDTTIEQLGLAYGIATRHTSWVATTKGATVDVTAPTRRQTVPQALPFGMSAQGVGLRAGGRIGGLAVNLTSGGARASRRKGRASREQDMQMRLPPEAADQMDIMGGGPEPTTTLGRIIRREDGRLILEITVDEDVDWDARSVVLIVGGVRHTLTPDERRTTRPTRLRAGQSARVAVAWDGETPEGIAVGDLEVALS